VINFKDKKLIQIRVWAWVAAVLPLTAPAGLFFVWRFTPDSFLGYAFIVGEIVMFSIAVIWWWWAMYTIRSLIKQWDSTKENVVEVSKDIKEIKSVIIETLSNDK